MKKYMTQAPASASTRKDELSVYLQAKLQECVDQGDIEQELQHATSFCKTHFETSNNQPSGISASVLSFQEIQTRLKTMIGAGMRGQVIFGGALSQLNLDVRASNDLDLARMRWACDNLKKPQDLSVMMGTTVISADQLDANLNGLLRVERDAEIDVAVLALWWFKDNRTIFDPLAQQSQNLIYSAENVGAGVNLSVERFLRVELEEAKRKITGQSAYRKSLALRDLVAEGNRERNGRSDAELAESLLMQKKELQEWNKDTCRRYLQVADRMGQNQRIQQLMQFQFKRDCLVDGISILRAACAAAPSADDLYFLLQTLYYEQVCKMRQTFKNKSKQGFDAVHVMRGLLLRNAFFNYCRQASPPIAQNTSARAVLRDKSGCWVTLARCVSPILPPPGLPKPLGNHQDVWQVAVVLQQVWRAGEWADRLQHPARAGGVRRPGP
jgi:hypothetical protein